MNLLGRAASLVVPALLLAACGDATSSRSGADDPTTSPSPTVPASPTETPTPSEETATPTATPSQDRPSVLTIEGLAQGAPPSVPYVYADPETDAWSLVRPGGQTQPLEGPVSAFAPIGNGLVVSTYGGVDASVTVLDGDLTPAGGSEARDGSLAATPDGSIVGWLGSDGTPHVIEAGGSRQLDLPQVRGGGDLAALISDGTTCKEGEGGSGCAAFVNSRNGGKAWSSVSHGLVDVVPGVISVGDVTTDGRMVAMTSVSDEGSCSGMFEVWEPTPIWETCEHTLFDFSPSGERILAGPAYLDGFGQGVAAVLDGDGKVLAEWHSRGHAAILHTIWEDDDHVLVIVFEDEHWAVLRLGVDDGSVEIAVPPVPDQDGQGAFVLPVR